MKQLDNNAPVIEFSHFTFQYRAQAEPTLRDISLTIHRGEKVLIVGPSGSGKSTLAHCINGLVPFFYAGTMQGSALIAGEDLAKTSIFKLSGRVGTVLQDPDGQFVGMTVAEDIAFKLENDGVPQGDMRRRVAEAAASVGMDRLLDASPHELSGGQKQRTTLAGVLVSKADVLLFDEPLANLDPQAGKQTIELIDRIHRETGKTIIIVEHRLEDVLHRNVDRIILIEEGRITADASPDELLCSGLLKRAGIREPLYWTAMQYAGCSLTPAMKPASLPSIPVGEWAEALAAWHEQEAAAAMEEPNRPTVLELTDVGFAYERGGRSVVKQVSFRIGQGELVSIVGRNGAGKSTLMKLICGFYKPTSGSIVYKGRDLAEDTIKERSERIGFVMQNPNHMISKTMLYEEVALGLVLRGLDEASIRERVMDTLRICGLYEMRNWPISALSFGQKKRVTIASILVLQPEVIILDEPTAGQDFRHYNEMMEFLLTLNRQGKSIVVITHDMHLMLEYADRAIVLSDGEVIADGAPAEVLTDTRIVEAASLKETSVYELALRAGIGEPKEFVRRFIERDRKERGA
ncbi:ABC transporter ATP-binding protein [Paenibacillus xylaniclasticus]|uniref:ABC transporter ATP-binding protein n=1 Tax=Paenibacillus xylaniclasticus TaxID=588083 RepID=UPI001FE48744|nr:ABC transporter ATP-binding protein [Paenibacillus xylaniclasticus]